MIITTTEQEQEEQEEDRPYTRQEIQTMLKTANDIRVKIIILLMASSGMRIGAIPLLKISNLTRIKKEDYKLYQINVYKKSKKSNYKTFCTPECAVMIDSYLDYRKHCGEQLKNEAPLIRDQFNQKDRFKTNNPRHLTKKTIEYLVNELLIKHSALKQKIKFDYEMKRKVGKNSTMQTHALRKFFNTECAKSGVYPDFIELMMGHKLPGVRSHYMKPDTNTLLEGTKEVKDYVAAIDSLTINEENRLKGENQKLKERITFTRNEISELKEAMTVMAKHINFPLDDFNKKFNTDF